MEPDPEATLDDLAIPGCKQWRRQYGAAGKPAPLCPSVYCQRCQTIRQISGHPVLEPYVGGQDG